MTPRPVTLAIILALSGSAALTGCDRASSLTEQEHIQRAKDFEDKGALKESVLELKNAIQKNPDNAQARLLLGEIYLRLGQGEEAEKEFSRAEKLGVNSESVKIQLGKSWVMAGDYKRVLDEISPSTGTTPRTRAAFLQLQGDALLGLRKLDEGCQRYKDALASDPKHAPAYWGMANCALARNNPTEARSMIDTALRLDNANPESWVVLADLERLNNNPQAALANYATALKHDPGKLSALFGRAQIYAFMNKPTEARAELEKLKKLTPNFYGTHFVEATLHYGAGKTDQALDSVQRTLKLRPSFKPAQLLYALLQYDRKSYENAAKALTAYLKQAPGHLEARKLLAATYLKLNQPDRTLDLLKPYIAAGKADAQVLALAGEAHLRGDNPGSARELFEKAAELVPASSALRTNVGLSELAAGKEIEAVRELEAASTLGSQDARADIALVYHFLGEKQFDQALAAATALEKKLPGSPGTYNLKGLAYLGKKDTVQARRNFERALELQPSLVSAAAQLAMLDIQENKLAAARGRYMAILDKDAKSIPAMVGLAELAALEKKEKEYLDWLEKAAKVSPAAYVPRAMLARYYIGIGSPRKALTIAREAASARPDSLDALDLLGRTQLAAGEMENARSTYSRLTSLSPKSAPAQYHLAQVYAALDNEKATRSALLKALELKPDYIDALAALSVLEARSGHSTAAIESARKLQSLGSPLGILLEGDAMMAEKRYAEAASLYGQAQTKTPSGKLAVRQHMALLRAGNAQKADDLLLGWLKAHPEDQASRSYLAESYTKRQLNPQAIAQYLVLLNASPNNTLALNNLANLYLAQQDPRALATAEKAYTLKPDHVAHLDTLGWILVQQGKISRGLPLIEQAAAGAPQHPEIRYHKAYALAKAGQTAAARQEINQLQKMKLSPALHRQTLQLLQSLPG